MPPATEGPEPWLAATESILTTEGIGAVTIASGSSAGPRLVTTREYWSVWPIGTELAPGVMVSPRLLTSRTGVEIVAELLAAAGSSSLAVTAAELARIVPGGAVGL